MWNQRTTGCCCGPDKSTAQISRTMSVYNFGGVPTAEIDQTIFWLDTLRADCDHKIKLLLQLKNDRSRASRHRRDMNALARQFYDDDSLHLDLETRTQIVRQRLGCDPDRARAIANLVDAWARKKRKTKRDELICLRYDAGIAPGKIAREFDLSRQQVYNILKNRKDLRFMG